MRRKCYSPVIALIILIISTGIAHAGDPQGALTAEQILGKMEAASSQIQDARLTIEYDDAHDKLVRRTAMAFKKPDKSRTETTLLLAGTEETVISVSDGEKTWSYTPSEQVGTISEMKVTGMKRPYTDPLSPFSTAEILDRYWVELKGTEELDGQTVYILHLTPKPGRGAGSPYSDLYNVEMSPLSVYSTNKFATYAVWTDSDPKAQYSRLSVDSNSFIVLRSEDNHSSGGTQQMEVTKTMELPGGIIFPVEVVNSASGAVSMRIAYNDVQINTGIPDETFTFVPPTEAVMLDQEAFDKRDETILEYEEKVKAEPDSPALRYALLRLYESGSYRQRRKMIEHLEKLIELKPDEAELYTRLGGAYLVTNRAEDALAAYQKALELNPDLELSDSLAQAYDRSGQREKAIEQYKLTLETATPDVGYTMPGIGGSRKPIQRLVQIYQDMDRLDELIEEYQARLDEAPENILFHKLMIEAYTMSQDRERTIAGYKRLIELMMDEVLSYGQIDYTLKRKLRALGIHHELEAFYEKTLETSVRRGYEVQQAHAELIAIYAEKKDLQKLISTYERLLEHSPRYAGQPLSYSIRESMSQADLAELIQKTQQQTPESATLYMLLGAMHLSERDLAGGVSYGSSGQQPGLAKAISMYERAAELTPDAPVAQLAMARAYVQKADYDMALRSYQRAMELEPDEQYYRAQVAYVYNRMEEHSAAIKMGREMVQEYPDEMASHGVLAMVYFNSEMYEDAIREYTKAIELAGEGYQSSVNFFRRCMVQIYESTEDYAKVDAIYQELGERLSGYDVAKIYAARGDTEQMVSYVLKALRTSSSRSLVEQLISELSDGDTLGELTAALEKELQSDPDNPGIYRALAMAYSDYQARNPQKAIQMYEKVTELDPADLSVYIQLGRLYSAQGVHDKAIEASKKVMQLAPEQTYLYASLAQIYVSAGRKEDALKQAAILERRAGYDGNSYMQLGRVYSLCELHDKAVEAYEKAIALTPNSYNSRYMRQSLATAYEAAGKQEKADALYEEVADTGSVYERMQVYERRGDLDKMVELARKIMKDDAQGGYTSYAQQQLVQAFQRQGKLDDLIALLQKDAEESPEDPVSYKMLAQVYSRQEDRDKAIEMYEKVIELTPDDGRAHGELGQLYDRQRMQDEALSAYRKAVKLGTDSFHIYARLARGYSRAGQTDKILALADDLKKRTNSGDSYYNLGQVYMSGQYYDEAIEAFKKSVRLSPQMSHYKSQLGQAYEQAGRMEEAEEFYEKSTDPDMLYQRMQTYSQQGDLEKLLETGNRILASSAQQYQKQNALQQLISGYSRQKKLGELLTIFHKRLAENPQDAKAYIPLGQIYMQQRDQAKATEMYEKAAILAPNNDDVQSNLGQLYQSQGMYQKAIVSYRKAMKLQPGRTYLYSSLANAYASMGKTDEALKLVDELRRHMQTQRSSGNQAYMQITLGDIYVAAKHYDEAIEAYKKAIELEPGNERYFKDKLARAYDQAGKSDLAAELRKSVRPTATSRPGQADMVGKPAPEFALRDLDGKEVKLADLKGKVVILDFWATWCGPCVKEIPHFIELYKQYQKQGFEMVGISTDRDGVGVVKSFVQRHKINYPILMADGKVQQAYGGIRAIPTTFVINKMGVIQRQYVGYRDKIVFEADIKALLAGESLAPMKSVPSAPTRRPARGSELEERVAKFDRRVAKELLVDLRKDGKLKIADKLEQRIEKKIEYISRGGMGNIIVGRVVVDGTIDPQDVNAQMEILEEGYFAGPVKDLHRPVGFRLHGYAPFNLELEGKQGPIVNVGTVHMTPLPVDELASLKGKLILDGSTDPTIADIHLSITHGPVNTPSNGTEPRPRWPDPIKARILPSGEFSAGGFSPAEHYVSFSAGGHVKQGRRLTFERGKTLDMGTVRLEAPKKLKLTYYVSEELPFDQAEEKHEILDAGSRWKSVDSIYGWDLEFKQKNGIVSLHYSYAPCEIADLGTGNITDFINVDPTKLRFTAPRGLEPKQGHVYLLDQKHWKHWVLFALEIEPEP